MVDLVSHKTSSVSSPRDGTPRRTGRTARGRSTPSSQPVEIGVRVVRQPCAGGVRVEERVELSRSTRSRWRTAIEAVVTSLRRRARRCRASAPSSGSGRSAGRRAIRYRGPGREVCHGHRHGRRGRGVVGIVVVGGSGPRSGTWSSVSVVGAARAWRQASVTRPVRSRSCVSVPRARVAEPCAASKRVSACAPQRASARMSGTMMERGAASSCGLDIRAGSGCVKKRTRRAHSPNVETTNASHLRG